MAKVTVAQQYVNPFEQKIEATYVFPLPQNAAVTDFLMKIGERVIRGLIREREEARRMYKEAKSQGYVAALLTLIGFSLNDTIVVFDRIRENLTRHRGVLPGDVALLADEEIAHGQRDQ